MAESCPPGPPSRVASVGIWPLGPVVGESLLKVNTFWPRSEGWEATLEEQRRQAVERLREAAGRRGADAVVGVHLRYYFIGGDSGVTLTAAIGTAVRLSEPQGRA